MPRSQSHIVLLDDVEDVVDDRQQLPVLVDDLDTAWLVQARGHPVVGRERRHPYLLRADDRSYLYSRRIEPAHLLVQHNAAVNLNAGNHAVDDVGRRECWVLM